MGQIIKWIVIIVVIVLAWKIVTRTSAPDDEKPGSACGPSAHRASDTWGSGLGRFVNPPYDLDAWASFRTSVENQIAQAEKDCGCESESCAKGRAAMRDLRSLIDDLDTAVRTGAPLPSDVVQRQEAIDNAIP